jgi:hypothetical protein
MSALGSTALVGGFLHRDRIAGLLRRLVLKGDANGVLQAKNYEARRQHCASDLIERQAVGHESVLRVRPKFRAV